MMNNTICYRQDHTDRLARLISAMRLFMLSAFMMLFSGMAQAQSDIPRLDITQGQIEPIPVAIAEFTGPDGLPSDVGRQISQVISDDLVSSGLFVTIDSAAFIRPPESPAIRPDFANWSPLGAKGLLIGSAYVDADGLLQIEFVLWDVVTQRNITEGGGSADMQGLRRIAHQIADFVYEEFTGDMPYFDTQIVYVSEEGLRTAGSSVWRLWIRMVITTGF